MAENEPQLSEAVTAADRTLARIRDEGLPAAYVDLQAAMNEYEARSGGTIEDLLPPEVQGLGFSIASLRNPEVFARTVICKDKKVRGAVHVTFDVVAHQGTHAGLIALTNTIAASLLLPPMALTVAGVLAAILIHKGLSSFCEGAG